MCSELLNIQNIEAKELGNGSLMGVQVALLYSKAYTPRKVARDIMSER